MLCFKYFIIENLVVKASELFLALRTPKSLTQQIAGLFKHNLNQNIIVKKLFYPTLGLISEANNIFYSTPLVQACATDGTKLPGYYKTGLD